MAKCTDKLAVNFSFFWDCSFNRKFQLLWENEMITPCCFSSCIQIWCLQDVRLAVPLCSCVDPHPTKSNSHFMDEGFICKGSLPCHFQDCLSTGESYFQISQGHPAIFFHMIIFLRGNVCVCLCARGQGEGAGGLQILCCRLLIVHIFLFANACEWN